MFLSLWANRGKKKKNPHTLTITIRDNAVNTCGSSKSGCDVQYSKVVDSNTTPIANESFKETPIELVWS